jgi:hypothetical protein
VIGLLRRPFAPLRQRLEATIARVAALPTLLDSAHPSVGRTPSAWIERAERECSGLRALLGDGGAEGDGRTGIEAFVAEAGGAGPALRAAAHRAMDAVGRLERRLREARGRTHDRYACGAEALDLLLRHGHFLPIGADEIERYALDQLAESEAYLREHARAFQASTWEEALAGLADVHPSTADYYTRHGELWAACRRAAESHRLVTWPDFPVRYLPRPPWVRAAARHLYFLAYHSPAPLDDLTETEYLVTPIEPDLPPVEQARLLRATNDSVIKLNHVVHHGGLGHHVQNWYAARARSRIGRIAAVDCASRIAFPRRHNGGGWSLLRYQAMGGRLLRPPGRSFRWPSRMAARAGRRGPSTRGAGFGRRPPSSRPLGLGRPLREPKRSKQPVPGTHGLLDGHRRHPPAPPERAPGGLGPVSRCSGPRVHPGDPGGRGNANRVVAGQRGIDHARGSGGRRCHRRTSPEAACLLRCLRGRRTTSSPAAGDERRPEGVSIINI